MCLATVTMCEDSKANWSYGLKWVFGITLAVSLVIGFFPQKDSTGKITYGLYTQGSDSTYVTRYWIACLIALASLIVLWQLIDILKSKPKIFYKIAIPCVCIVSIIYGNVFIFSGRTHSYNKEIIVDSLIEGEVYLEEQTDNFRIDTYDCVDNTSMYLGYQGINAFHSVVPPSIMEFYEYIGIKRSVASRPETSYRALRGLLSVKYLLNRKDGKSFVDTSTNKTLIPGFTYLKSEGGYYVYKNDYFVPYGFSYDYYMDYEFCERYQNQDRAHLMLKALLLTDEQIEKYGHLLKDIREPENDVSSWLFFDEDYYRDDCQKLAITSADYFKTDNKGFTAKVTRTKEDLVFFSVPYEKGWSATVNGKPVEVENVNVGFMAVKVDAGESVIRFNYQTPLLKEGLLITCIGCFIFAAYIFLYTSYKRKHNVKNIYPEGDILLHQWLADENAEELPEVPKPKKKSILDDNPSIDIPNIPPEFDGGFKINRNILDDEK